VRFGPPRGPMEPVIMPSSHFSSTAASSGVVAGGLSGSCITEPITAAPHAPGRIKTTMESMVVFVCRRTDYDLRPGVLPQLVGTRAGLRRDFMRWRTPGWHLLGRL
jgi:hypothetical protein